MIVGIENEIQYLHSLGLLKPLLIDRTTRSNILWATDAYEELGYDYNHDQEIRAEQITNGHSNIIKTRACKELEMQSARTRQRAEVFTPVWICKKMNDYADDDWFGRPGVFDSEKIIFPEGKTWTQYVDSCRMEITCGEAPYLVSRYNAEDGKYIPVKERIGILDRKLRVVTENASSEEEWVKWTVRAFQATYGFEFQGDNLLISRVNLVMTFVEHMEACWHRKPTDKEYKQIIKIVSWNLWQMDGLTMAIPYSKGEAEYQQMNFFDYWGIGECEKKKETLIDCRIYDWKANRSIAFKELKKGE